MIKKLLTRTAIAGGTLAIVIAGAAAFSAFEAHVVNVTATINNALTVPQEASGISFGAIFPEEVAHQPLNVSLSSSFLSESSVDDVSYMIRQKPKCVSDTDPTVHPQVTEQGQTFVCPAGSHEMPLLCPYLSKHLVVNGCDPTLPVGTPNACTGIDAFHGTASSTLWTEAVTEATEVTGHLTKAGGDTSDNWDIDLHAPCFSGQCAQDNVIPTAFQADPSQEGQTFGCDLWVEVSGISTTTTSTIPQLGNLTVTKIVDNTGGGTKQVSDFPLFVDGNLVTSGVPTSTTATTHQVSETSDPNYVASFSGDCGSTGLVTVPANGNAVCTLTNTFSPLPGTLTVTKVVVGGTAAASDFTINVSGGAPSSFPGSSSGTAVTIAGGASYSVTEATSSPTGYVATFSPGCSGIMTPAGTPTCTVTNTFQTGAIIVHKVVSDPGQVSTQTAGQFQMQIDGNDVAQDATTTVSTGTHTVSEVNSQGDTVSFSVDCNSSGQVTVAQGDVKQCTVTNTVPFGTLTITKVVNNVNGGTAVVSDFTLFVGPTKVTSGVTHNFLPGTYTIAEGGVRGYQGVFTGACNGVNSVTLNAGDNVTCTITNTDIRPTITLVKQLTGNGTAAVQDFSMFIDGTFVPSGSSLSVTSNAAHSISETADNAGAGYTNTAVSGTSAFGISCPGAPLPGSLTLAPGDSIVCTITNNHP